MKKLFLISAIVAVAFSNDFCIDIKYSKKLLEEASKQNPYIPVNILEKRLKKAIFFAKKYQNKDKKYLATLAVIDAFSKAYEKELFKKYAPNDKVIKSFYEEYKNSFAKEELISFSSIKVKTLSLADKIYKELKQNPSLFDKLAKKYSLDDINTFKDVPLSKFNYEVREKLREAKVGEILPPIKIGEFYLIDKINNKKTITPTYENLKPKIKDILVRIYVKKLLDKMYEEGK